MKKPSIVKSAYIKSILIGLSLISLTRCDTRIELPPGDADNGGLFLPENFEAVVVADITGRARHIAVNDNGDIFSLY